jgi:hypothetical protein
MNYKTLLRIMTGVALGTTLAAVGAVAQSATAQTTVATHVQLSSTSQGSGTAVVNIKIPSSGGSGKLLIHLNGKDVAVRFTDADCSNARCKTATLTTSDGLRAEKNVIAVDAGNGLSSRLRFDAQGTAASTASVNTKLRALTSASGQTVSSGIAAPFMPPTLAFNTINAGGWNGSGAWFKIGTNSFPSATPTGCAGATYLVVVLDRQTLTEKTSSPESSPQCQANAAALNTYLKTLSADDLAIVGTVYLKNADAGLDTTPIGGTAYGDTIVTGYPAGYMAIGVGGATPGTAFEPFYTSASGYESVPPFATGTMQEDAYGNYNFLTSAIAEFAVSPNDPSYLTQNNTSAISIQNINPAPFQHIVYTPPSGSTDGYWLLLLSRNNLDTYPYACPSTGQSPDGTSQYFAGCGTFYNTGSSNAATSKAAYLQLANDLNAVNAWELAFLTTVGQAAYGGSSSSIWNVGGFNGSYSSPSNGFQEFSAAIERLGGSPNLTLSLLSPTTAYTLISSPGNGGPLNGASTESTTTLSAQGQTGLVHGILQRNLNGLFLPGQTTQENTTLFQAKNGTSSPEFRLTEISLQQPADWPSSSSNTLLTAGPIPANSIPGQIAAYRYLSYVLLHNIYVQGLQGSHQDDIHYFFTGSANTSLNYHIYDPQFIQWPDASAIGPYVLQCDSISGSTCTSNIFGTNDPLVFTENDFLAVRNQLSSEIHYLTDSLQFLVTGSTNMKDVIAGGNSNVGLALTGAGATILGSKLVPAAPTTVVKTSWQNIVSMIGGVASLTSAIPGLGEIAGIAALGANAAKVFGGTASAVGGIAGIAAGAGQITSASTTNSLPSSFAKFSIQIGNLANGSMQGQLSSGFDTTVDSITSDWGRLAALGPMVVDSDNPVFFAPNQLAQTVAVAALSQAASRSFYLSLMPIFYNVHYWQGVSGDSTTPGNNLADMGYYSESAGAEYYCSAYYLSPQQNQKGSTLAGLGAMPANTSIFYPSSGGTPEWFDKDYSTTPINYYVIAGSTTGAGSDNASIQVLDANLGANLFTPNGLNLPIDEFVTPQGPMSATWVDAHAKNPASHTAPTVCNARLYPTDGAPTEPGEGDSVGSSGGTIGTGLTATTTTLAAPTSSLQGNNVTLTATVMAGSSKVTTGQVYFLDGGVIVSTVPLDATGTASATWGTLSLGAHSLQAKYARVDPYDTSSSAVIALNVYSSAPDFYLSVSDSTLQAGYGSTSAPLTLQATSIAGLARAVNFSCTGLPAGMSCNFNPAQVTIAAGGVVTTSLTVTGATQTSSLPSHSGLLALLLPGSLLCVFRARKGIRSVGAALLVLVLSVAVCSSLTGCAGSSNNGSAETGSRTILVNASTTTVTKSIPVVVNIQ